MQCAHGGAPYGSRRLAAAGGAGFEAGRAGIVVEEVPGGELRQRGRGAPAAGGGEGDRGRLEDGAAGGPGLPPGTARTGPGDGAFRDGARIPDADRLRRAAGAGRGRAGRGAPVRGDPWLFAAAVRAGVRGRVAAVVVRGHGGGVPALRRGAGDGADGQRQGAGVAAAAGLVVVGVPSAAVGVRGALELRAAGLPARAGADQGEGRAERGLREEQRHRWPGVRQLGGAGGAPVGLAAGGGRPAHARDDG